VSLTDTFPVYECGVDSSRPVWTFGGVEPLISLTPPALVSLHTEDCFCGLIRTPADRFTEVCTMPFVNPQAGPIEVRGAEPGDTLAVHLLSIEPAREWAASTNIPLFGALTGTSMTPTLQEPLAERVWIWEIDRAARTCTFVPHDTAAPISLPLDPMFGTVGVAPAGAEVRSSLVPGPYGGNLDTPEMRVGVTVYLGVNVPGAMLSLGDGHARQGEGEPCGVAVESAMDALIAIDLIKGVDTPWPRLESDRHLISTGSARPLEDAFRIAQADLITWVGRETGLGPLEAHQLLSQIVESPLANVCNPAYTAVAKVAKGLLPARTDRYAGVHERWRAASRAQGP
jgi:acetamidase/formamidase